MNYICILIILVSTIDYCCVRVEHILTCKPMMYANSELQWTRYNAFKGIILELYMCVTNDAVRMDIYRVFDEYDRVCVGCFNMVLLVISNLTRT